MQQEEQDRLWQEDHLRLGREDRLWLGQECHLRLGQAEQDVPLCPHKVKETCRVACAETRQVLPAPIFEEEK